MHRSAIPSVVVRAQTATSMKSVGAKCLKLRIGTMKKLIILAGFFAATALPSMAFAATRCQQENANHEVAGTVIGAIAGGLLGNAVSHGGGKAGGTAIGAVGGAVIGNRLAAGSNGQCPEGYRAYDDGAPAYDHDGRPSSAEAYGRDSSAYDRSDRHDGYDRNRSGGDDASDYPASNTWRDSDGRICHWRDQADDRMNHQWVQACR
jgi:hypothetical protein